jgi:RimJ/RimL family protein N-acetyltransferase
MRFRLLTEDDLPTLLEWLRRPHLAEWWEGCDSLEELKEEYLPSMDERPRTRGYIASLDGTDIGYIQAYVAMDAGDGWWVEERDPGVRGIDQFLADGKQLGRGIGTRMVMSFAALLFEDEAVTKIQADPSPGNGRAIRCYEKAGFRKAGRIDTPDGEAMLMVLERGQDG